MYKVKYTEYLTSFFPYLIDDGKFFRKNVN